MTLGVLLAGLFVFINVPWYMEVNRRAEILAARRKKRQEAMESMKRMDESLRRLKTLSIEEGEIDCKICMENVANVVLVPCNHLIMCVACYKRTIS